MSEFVPFPKGAVGAGNALTPEQAHLWEWAVNRLPSAPYSVWQLACEAVTAGWILSDRGPSSCTFAHYDNDGVGHEIRVWFNNDRFLNAAEWRLVPVDRFRKLADTSAALVAHIVGAS